MSLQVCTVFNCCQTKFEVCTNYISPMVSVLHEKEYWYFKGFNDWKGSVISASEVIIKKPNMLSFRSLNTLLLTNDFGNLNVKLNCRVLDGIFILNALSLFLFIENSHGLSNYVRSFLPILLIIFFLVPFRINFICKRSKLNFDEDLEC